MSILEISQIIFNLIISLAVIVIAVFISLITYKIIKFIKVTKKLLDDIGKESSEIYKKIDKFLLTIFSMSFISKFFKKKIKK
jgi:hypothetical protein